MLAETLRLGPHDITHRSQLRVGDLAATEQLGVLLCNPSATDQCESQHVPLLDRAFVQLCMASTAIAR